MNEIATRDASKRFPDGATLTAIFAIHDDGTVTRQITSRDGRPDVNRPTPFRWLNADERRINCADGISAYGFLLGVIRADGWTEA